MVKGLNITVTKIVQQLETMVTSGWDYYYYYYYYYWISWGVLYGCSCSHFAINWRKMATQLLSLV